LFAVHFYSSSSRVASSQSRRVSFHFARKPDTVLQNEENKATIERGVFFHAPPSSTWVVKVTCEIMTEREAEFAFEKVPVDGFHGDSGEPFGSHSLGGDQIDRRRPPKLVLKPLSS
jgi:hypothetical protein